MGTRFTPTAHSSPRPPAAHPHPRAGGEHRWTDSILGTFPSPEQEQDEPRVGGGVRGGCMCRIHRPREARRSAPHPACSLLYTD